METFIAHPQWNGEIYNGFDIALARLPREVRNATCPSLPHEERTFRHNTIVVALGWGLIGPSQMPNNLQMAQGLKILDPKLCPGSVKKYLKSHMLCAYSSIMNVCKGGTVFVEFFGVSSLFLVLH